MFDQDGSNGSGLTGSDLCVTVLEPCFVALRSLDPRSCDAGSVLRHLGDLGRLRGLIDSVEAGLSRRADTLHEGGKSRDGHDSLQGTQRASNADAKKRTRRANTLEKVPMLDIALAQGTINADHADAFAGVLETATDTTKQGLVDQAPGLVDAAKTLQPDTFRRHLCRAVDRIERDDGLKRSKRQHQATKVRKWINRTTGMYHLNGELDPELGARLFTALESEVETRWHGAKDLPLDQRPSNDRITAETLVDLVASAVNQLRPNRPELSVLIDYQTLLSGLHEHSTCETAEGVDLAPETIRRLACDANIIPIVMNGPNQRLDVGRANRTATTPQRKALRALLRDRRLRHPIRFLPHPPLDQRRNNRPRKPCPALQQTPPPSSRKWLDDQAQQRPHRRIHTTHTATGRTSRRTSRREPQLAAAAPKPQNHARPTTTTPIEPTTRHPATAPTTQTITHHCRRTMNVIDEIRASQSTQSRLAGGRPRPSSPAAIQRMASDRPEHRVCDAATVKRRRTKHRLVEHRPLEVQVCVVFPGEADPTVGPDRVATNVDSRIARISLCVGPRDRARWPSDLKIHCLRGLLHDNAGGLDHEPVVSQSMFDRLERANRTPKLFATRDIVHRVLDDDLG